MRPLVVPALIAASLVVSLPARPQTFVQQQSVNLSGMASVSRPVDKTYPVTGAPKVYVSNRAGMVRVVPWEDRIVRVQALIQAGADTVARAERFAQAIDVDGAHVGDRIEVRTRYPQVDPKDQIGGYGTDMEISVPSDASIEIDNEWGDVYVSGLRGNVTIVARFGEVHLQHLEGTVRVNARGPFKLTARNLNAGGSFTLRNTEAEFSNVRGDFHIDNYLGSVALYPGADPVNLDVSSESGPIELHLGSGVLPDLIATADSGSIESNIVLASESWGGTTTMRHESAGATQHIDLFTSFSEIDIKQESLAAVPEPLVAPGGSPLTESFERKFDVLPGTGLELNLMPGDITIEGHDGTKVEVDATKFVRVTNVASTRLALEGLVLRADFGAENLSLQTLVQEDMAALGCTEYWMDMLVRVPRGVPVILRSREGETKVANLVSNLTVEQGAGAVSLENIQGTVGVSVASGSIQTANTAGSLRLTASGDVSVLRPFGPVEVHCDGGNTIIDTPGAGVSAHSKGGDVRLIAVDGVRDDYDIEAENGNISIAVPDTEDADFIIRVYEGSVYSSVPVTGTSHRGNHTYQGRLNAGTRQIRLEARQGNVVID